MTVIRKDEMDAALAVGYELVRPLSFLRKRYYTKKEKLVSKSDLFYAFEIFENYKESAQTPYISAEHDEIWIGGLKNPDEFSAEDVTELEKLGWHIDNEYNCFHKFT